MTQIMNVPLSRHAIIKVEYWHRSNSATTVVTPETVLPSLFPPTSRLLDARPLEESYLIFWVRETATAQLVFY